MTKSVTCPEELGGLASQVTVDYVQLAHQGRLAAATAEPEEVIRPASVLYLKYALLPSIQNYLFTLCCNFFLNF